MERRSARASDPAADRVPRSMAERSDTPLRPRERVNDAPLSARLKPSRYPQPCPRYSPHPPRSSSASEVTLALDGNKPGGLDVASDIGQGRAPRAIRRI